MPKAQKKGTEVETLIVDKFIGNLTRYRDGDINSGKANYYVSWGYDCFAFSGTLTFSQGTTSISKGVITDLILDGKVHIENGVTYMYAIGHLKRLYKIQVNNPSASNPDYDNPVLLATLNNNQTFQFAGSLDFYQGNSSEKIWIGHDVGITKINFDGSGETNLIGGSWITNVPRQQVQQAGKLYFTNGSNLASVDGTEAVTSYAVLSPGFPVNMQARDIDITSDGTYIVTTLTRNPIGVISQVTPNAPDAAAMFSMIVYWNGTDAAASSSKQYPSFSMSSYFTFSAFEYVFGQQVAGSHFGDTNKVLFIDEFDDPPMPNAVISSGDLIGYMTTMWNNGFKQAVLNLYGTIDADTPKGMYRQLLQSSTLTNGDIIKVPFCGIVSSFNQGGHSSGYTDQFNTTGTGKSYFSTLEYDGVNTTYGFYSMKNVTDFLGAANTGVYETQHQPFSKKIKASEIRVYLEPASANTSFTIDLIGIDGSVISGGSKTFSSITGQDLVQYNPAHAPTACLGVRITNAGAVTPFIHRIEIDYSPYGK